jgi:hypothetical protein
MVRWARSVARRLEDHDVIARVVAPGFGPGPKRGKGPEPQRVLIQGNESRANPSAESGACWTLSLDEKGVDVALEIPTSATGEASSLRVLLDDERRRAELVGLLGLLPEAFRLGLQGEPGIRAAGAGAEEPSILKNLLERAATSGRSVCIGWNVPRDVAVSHVGLLDEQLEEAIVLLAPIYKLLTRNDDAQVVARGRSKGRAGFRARRPSRAATRVKSDEDSIPASLERGARVRVLAGPFAGKVGVVKELDGKGGAHVMLGLLATRIELKDLSASAAGRRPTLSSSHRKPVGLR